jgi:hypothetical protein
MLKQARERLPLILDGQLLCASFALAVGGILLGCLEIMTLNVSSGIPGGIIALIGLVGIIGSLLLHRREPGEPPRPLFEDGGPDWPLPF